jgi:hypothetical protein
MAIGAGNQHCAPYDQALLKIAGADVQVGMRSMRFMRCGCIELKNNHH